MEAALKKAWWEDLEGDVAEYQCEWCGEWFTELEVVEMTRKGEHCENCGGSNFVKAV